MGSLEREREIKFPSRIFIIYIIKSFSPSSQGSKINYRGPFDLTEHFLLKLAGTVCETLKQGMRGGWAWRDAGEQARRPLASAVFWNGQMGLGRGLCVQ